MKTIKCVVFFDDSLIYLLVKSILKTANCIVNQHILISILPSGFPIWLVYKLLINQHFTLQFLLRQAFADDEASTRLLQVLLFLLLSTASLMFIPCAIRSSFTFVSIMLRFLGPICQVVTTPLLVG